MAATVTTVKSFVTGDRRVSIVNVTGDASYATGGYALTNQQIGGDLETDLVIPTTATTGHTAAWNASTGKLMFFAGGTEVTNATNVSTVTVPVLVYGKTGNPSIP